jgi:hypothetical protein
LWWPTGNRDGDLTSVSEKFHLSWDDFEKEALPNLTGADLVLFVDFDDDANPATADIQRLLQAVRKTPANLSALLIARRQQTVRRTHHRTHTHHRTRTRTRRLLR